MATEWFVAFKANGNVFYITEQADLRHLSREKDKAHIFTTRPIADAVARMLNEIVMDAVLSGNVVPNVRFNVYENN